MAAVLLPIGHYMGPIVTPGETSWMFGVRLGDAVEDLDDGEFGVWALAHAQLDPQIAPAPSRASLVSLAGDASLAAAAETIDRLVARGLLARVLPVPSDARAFAERHQLFPLGYGLGNSASEPSRFAVGFPPERPRMTIGLGVFDVWAFASRASSLWRACEDVAVADGEVTPAKALAEVMSSMPLILATDAAYLDVV